MKALIITLVVIGLSAGGIYLANTTSPSSSDASVTSPKKLADTTVVYDVRTPEEFAAGHAVGAINLPLANIQAGSYPEVSKDSPIAVYCRSGNRSSEATRILENAGYTDITDIGAYGSLQEYGLSTT